jgi:hypothetical protein
MPNSKSIPITLFAACLMGGLGTLGGCGGGVGESASLSSTSAAAAAPAPAPTPTPAATPDQAPGGTLEPGRPDLILK